MVRAHSSGVEHCIDIAGVGSSNLPVPTITENTKTRLSPAGFCLFGAHTAPLALEA